MTNNKKHRIERVMFALDLGFSDLYNGENVRQLTLERKLQVIEGAVEIIQAEEAINFSLFQSFSPSHPSPDIYATDFPSALRASIYLLLGGYYRQAISCVRDWLEIRLTGIYYGFVECDSSKYIDWKQGKYEGPFGRNLVRRLFARAEFRNADVQLGLRDRMSDLYANLSAFAHAGMLSIHDLQSHTDNVPRFNPQSIDLWFGFVRRAFSELLFCFFVAYGEKGFSQLGEEERRTLRNYLSPEYCSELSRAGVV